jgi:glycosyltransferase involved in cell wall biosynthesis
MTQILDLSSTRLAIFATHPVQYLSALWRALAAVPGLTVHVYYFSDVSVRGAVDPGFGVPVAWDVPLLQGYDHTFLSRDADISKPWRIGLSDARALLKEGRYDWVLLEGYNHRFERQVLRAANACGARAVMRGEFADISQNTQLKGLLRTAYLRWFYSQVDAFCTVGQTAKQHLVKHGVSPNRLFFSPYHVDSDLFTQHAVCFQRETCRSELGIDKDSFVLIFSGKLIPRKEPRLLLEAIRLLPARENLALILLGSGELNQQVCEMGRALLNERFIAPGFVNQSKLGRYFAAADLHVIPSNHETWGLVVNEAMYFGLPSVASDRVGCNPDLVRPGETGIVFASGDVQDLARKLWTLMENPDATRTMGDAAKRLITRYSIESARDGVLQAMGLKEPVPWASPSTSDVANATTASKKSFVDFCTCSNVIRC